MRRLAALVSLAAVGMAVLVFLFFPRGTGAGMFGELTLQPSALTGISDEVSFTNITNIAQNNEIVAQVEASKNGRAIEGTQTLMLRGQTLDEYKGHKWLRSQSPAGDSRDREWNVDPYFEPYRDAEEMRAGLDVYRLKIALRPTRTKMLFAMPGLLKFTPARPIGRVRYASDDQTLSTPAELNQRLDYEVECLNTFIEPSVTERVVGDVTRTNARPLSAGIPERVAAYARRPEVSGVDAQNRPLASLRPRDAVVSPLDKEIASNIERHLRTTFSYTLDLTGEKRTEGADPNEDFLYVWKKGHCEYFASAMVLMCQSLGIQARFVTGFKCDEYDPNPGHYYVVRQSHAHAWVEVRTAAGWQTFDPTSGNDAGGHHGRSAWQAVKHFFDWLDFKWAEKVVAYDADRRENLISSVDRAVVNTMLNAKMNPNGMSNRTREWWRSMVDDFDTWMAQAGWMVSAKLIFALILFLIAACLFVIGKFVVQRRRMRKRAARIGLDNLPTGEQIRLAKQLGFYEQLTTMLARRRIMRLRHQTPEEFGDSLSFLPNEAFDTIRRLTRVYYRVRYGRQELDQDEQRDLEATVEGLAPILDHVVVVR
jgi:transglutaminase-like putative cysteine protease